MKYKRSIEPMKYKVVLIESEEGVAASCPQLRGCHSQGATIDEALENIKIAIREWLDVEKEELKAFRVIEREVVV
jgi:predicted RNase H-like HicB family nuclease